MFENGCKNKDPFFNERILLNSLHSELNVPYEKRISWEELNIDNPLLASQIHYYINNYKEHCRQESFNIISNDCTLRSHLKYTKLCTSVKNNTECPHGINCLFAHSLNDLRISNCAFGDNCRFINYKDGIYYNVSSKICTHIHPFETHDNFKKRCQL